MIKLILKASAIMLMTVSITFISCESVKKCCSNNSCKKDSAATQASTCQKCGKNTCDKSCSANPSEVK